ncbi:MAG: metal ABC transporter substrate-binding protein [Candidatus Magasanikbacteria bacterium]|nr:metal ABC transporter substrate-binding protein [Candidatus Magasanikbacteria bacterium]
MSRKNIIITVTILLALSAALFFAFHEKKVLGEKIIDDKLTVLSTFTVISDMVGEVGGDRIEAISLTKPGVEIHGYEPTPGDLIRASKADIIFDNGMNLEVWANKLYTSIPDVPHVTLTKGIEPIQIAEGAYKDKPNPHVWMSPAQALVYVENIRTALSELSPDDAEYFTEQARVYSEKIKTLDTKLRESISEIPENQRYLTTCEGAFSYLAKDYGMKELYLWAINDESQGSPQQIAYVVDEIKRKNIPVVFCESTIQPQIQEEVVQESGARMGGVLYVDSLSAVDGPAPTYLKLLEHTVETIIKGLKGE